MYMDNWRKNGVYMIKLSNTIKCCNNYLNKQCIMTVYNDV